MVTGALSNVLGKDAYRNCCAPTLWLSRWPTAPARRPLFFRPKRSLSRCFVRWITRATAPTSCSLCHLLCGRAKPPPAALPAEHRATANWPITISTWRFRRSMKSGPTGLPEDQCASRGGRGERGGSPGRSRRGVAALAKVAGPLRRSHQHAGGRKSGCWPALAALGRSRNSEKRIPKATFIQRHLRHG